MGAIFPKAFRVVSWLGLREADSNKAIALLQEIAHEMFMIWDTFEVWSRSREADNNFKFFGRRTPECQTTQDLILQNRVSLKMDC